jgi:hypothetical protein
MFVYTLLLVFTTNIAFIPGFDRDECAQGMRDIARFVPHDQIQLMICMKAGIAV